MENPRFKLLLCHLSRFYIYIRYRLATFADLNLDQSNHTSDLYNSLFTSYTALSLLPKT